MRRWWPLLLLGLIIAGVFVPPVVVLGSVAADNGGWLAMPDALAFISVVAGIIIAVIKFVPAPSAKNQQPINISITWPDRVPDHFHHDYVPRNECKLAREGFGREIGDIKRGGK